MGWGPGGVGGVRTPTPTLISPQHYHLSYPLGDHMHLFIHSLQKINNFFCWDLSPELHLSSSPSMIHHCQLLIEILCLMELGCFLAFYLCSKLFQVYDAIFIISTIWIYILFMIMISFLLEFN